MFLGSKKKRGGRVREDEVEQHNCATSSTVETERERENVDDVIFPVRHTMK